MFKDKTAQIFCCYSSLGRRKVLCEEEVTLDFFPCFWAFMYLCGGKHGYMRESGCDLTQLRPIVMSHLMLLTVAQT